jgi:hypothetical protein
MNRAFCLPCRIAAFLAASRKDLSLLVVHTYATVSSLELTKREIVMSLDRAALL